MHIANERQLTFCTNIYPGENWEVTFSELKKNVPAVKNTICKDESFGLGLRLSHQASEELGLGKNLTAFKKWLDDNALYVFTMNGFPYGKFHKEAVKDRVHAPDWTTQERVHYTKMLAQQLAFLLPERTSGGISTSPISYKYWHTSAESLNEVKLKSAENYIEIASFLHKLEEETGHHIHLDIEPEPDGILENTADVLSFYKEYLLPVSQEKLTGNKSGKSAEEVVKRYLQICYDICHFSLAFEEPQDTFSLLKEAGISIGKIQISAALKILFTEHNHNKIWKSLERFNEPTYLHQVTEKRNGTVTTYPDLPKVLDSKQKFKELRAHFHVPIFLEEFQGLYATQETILKTFDYLKTHHLTQHLEVETYTWEVLPDKLKIDLASSITRELKWVLNRINN